MKRLSLAACSLLLVAAACAPPTAQDSAEIRAGSAAWEEALNAADLDGVVALYHEDAHVLPPNAAPGRGHDAVRESFGAMIDAGLAGTLSTVETAAAGDLGHHVGTYEISAGGEVVDRGKFIEVWRQRGGEWKIAADIWNSDMPAAPAGATLLGFHQVEDADRWLAAWSGPEGRRADFAANGAPAVRVFQSPDDPNLTGVAITVEDMDAFMTWLQSDAGSQAKAEDGVIDATVRVLAEVE